MASSGIPLSTDADMQISRSLFAARRVGARASANSWMKSPAPVGAALMTFHLRVADFVSVRGANA
jgi:hypothetical protein